VSTKGIAIPDPRDKLAAAVKNPTGRDAASAKLIYAGFFATCIDGTAAYSWNALPRPLVKSSAANNQRAPRRLARKSVTLEPTASTMPDPSRPEHLRPDVAYDL
jgi:hypothetical protein